VDERMIISFIEEVQYTRRPMYTFCSHRISQKNCKKSRGAAQKILAKLPEKPSELQ
jgi:hypothetical protein